VHISVDWLELGDATAPELAATASFLEA